MHTHSYIAGLPHNWFAWQVNTKQTENATEGLKKWKALWHTFSLLYSCSAHKAGQLALHFFYRILSSLCCTCTYITLWPTWNPFRNVQYAIVHHIMCEHDCAQLCNFLPKMHISLHWFWPCPPVLNRPAHLVRTSPPQTHTHTLCCFPKPVLKNHSKSIDINIHLVNIKQFKYNLVLWIIGLQISEH